MAADSHTGSTNQFLKLYKYKYSTSASAISTSTRMCKDCKDYPICTAKTCPEGVKHTIDMHILWNEQHR